MCKYLFFVCLYENFHTYESDGITQSEHFLMKLQIIFCVVYLLTHVSISNCKYFPAFSEKRDTSLFIINNILQYIKRCKVIYN